MTEQAAISDDRPPRRLTPFLPTRQHRRFAEFAAAVRWHRFMRSAVLPPALMASRTAMLTPGVTTTPRDLELQLLNRCYALNADIARTLHRASNLELSREPILGLELLIIDLSRGCHYAEGDRRLGRMR